VGRAEFRVRAKSAIENMGRFFLTCRTRGGGTWGRGSAEAFDKSGRHGTCSSHQLPRVRAAIRSVTKARPGDGEGSVFNRNRAGCAGLMAGIAPINCYPGDRLGDRVRIFDTQAGVSRSRSGAKGRSWLRPWVYYMPPRTEKGRTASVGGYDLFIHARGRDITTHWMRSTGFSQETIAKLAYWAVRTCRVVNDGARADRANRMKCTSSWWDPRSCSEDGPVVTGGQGIADNKWSNRNDFHWMVGYRWRQRSHGRGPGRAPVTGLFWRSGWPQRPMGGEAGRAGRWISSRAGGAGFIKRVHRGRVRGL